MFEVRSWQLIRQRRNFVRALKKARCPKDGGRMLEVSMPNVVCSTCSTRYVLAVQPRSFLTPLNWKLIEGGGVAPEMVKEKETIERVVVKIRCRNCGQTFEETQDRCPNCGAPA
jgi:Zn finger protein HypA/HybF involved in hydrogenase expression